MKNRIKTLAIIFFTSSCSQSTDNKNNNLESVKQKISISESNVSEKQLKEFRDEIQYIYKELLEFKDNKDFHKNGFKIGTKYNEWLINIQKHKENPLAKELLKEMIVVGEIESLGMQYLYSSGEETEVTKVFTKSLNLAFNLKEESRIDELNHIKIEEINQGEIFGIWKITNSTVNQSYEFKIMKQADNFIGVIDNDLTKPEVLIKKGNKYIVEGNRFGEYYTIDAKRKMELFDQDGELKSAGYTAKLIK
jgi:hypothetical protein